MASKVYPMLKLCTIESMCERVYVPYKALYNEQLWVRWLGFNCQ